MADLKKLDSALSGIRKKYGNDVIADLEKRSNVPRYPLSSPSLSYLLGGGSPQGRIIEIYGPESSGKSLVATILAADIQNLTKGFVALIDAECSFDSQFASNFGLSTHKDKFILAQPDYGEQALSVLDSFIDTGEVNFIIVDSVAALVPLAELEGEMEDNSMGLQARMMGQALRKITTKVFKSNTTVIFINQIRMKIGTTYGNPETTPGGNALKFFASIRIDVRKREYIGNQDKGLVTGLAIKLKTIKNKTATPFRKIELEIDFKKGIDCHLEYVTFGVIYKLIKQGGAWFTLGEKKFQGKSRMADYLREDEEVFLKLKKQVDSFLAGETEVLDIEEEDIQDKVVDPEAVEEPKTEIKTRKKKDKTPTKIAKGSKEK